MRKFKGMFKSVQGILAAIAIAALVVYGGSKPQTNSLMHVIRPQIQQIQQISRDALQAVKPAVVNPRRLGMLSGDGESTNETVYALTQNQIDAGFALARIGTNETHDFSASADATIHGPWRLRGANINRFAFNSGASAPWSIPFGTNWIDGLTVYSTGVLLPKTTDEASVARSRFRDARPLLSGVEATGGVLAPFRANLGVVPEMNWGMLPSNAVPSEVWWTVTPSNSVIVTYENALLGRDTNTPVCVQVEFLENGNFIYRYDLSRAGMWNGENMTNILVGAFNAGHGESLDVTAVTNLTSIFWHRIEPDDTPTGDRDGDGLSTAEEIFRTHTDPGLWDTDGDGSSDGEEDIAGTNPLSRDSDGDGLVDGSDPDPVTITPLDDLDGDGIPDAYEDYWFGGTNVFNVTTNRDETGFTLGTKILGGINPTNDVAAANIVSTNSLVSWKLFDGFAADWPANATNLVWERTFSINRTSAWQQFFISAAPTNVAPWSLRGMTLEWETNDGLAGTLSSSPVGDSFRLPFSTNDVPSVLTLRLRATGAHLVQSPTPLHLIAYSPEFRIEGGCKITGDSGTEFYVFMDGSDSQISLVIDHSLRPCRATPGADECDMAELGEMSMENGDFSFEGDARGGTIYAHRPGMYDLPDYSLSISLPAVQRAMRCVASRNGSDTGERIIVLDPSAGWSCSGHGCAYDGLGYDWESDWYYEEDYYPLDSKCLRKKWYRDWGGGWYGGACELYVSSGVNEDDIGCVTTAVDGDTGRVYVDGIEVWSDKPEHTYDDVGCGGDYHEDYLGDGCDDCDTDCADGNCDNLEGPGLGSLKFRIPLGAPVKGQVAGFVWFSTDDPINISKSTFQLLEHPNAEVSDYNSSGTRRIVCYDSRGRDLRIENIANGVRITIYETAAQTLEHTWEIVNVNGSDSQIRLKKISRLNNIMSDETFTYENGDWTRFDNIAGVGTQLTIYNGFSEYGDGSKCEERTTTDANGNTLSSVYTEQSRVGECENAVMRETYRSESTGLGYKWSSADYWNDPAHSARHGKPRLVQGNARAWVYTDFDENGHETLRVEQRGNTSVPSDFPYVVSNELQNASTLADAFVTIRDFTPLAGDSRHEDDAARPRIETRYVVTNGVATIIGRTWARYTRLNRDGYAAVKKETWHAATNDAEFGDASNAYSYEIAFSDTGDGTPLLMRSAAAETLDENGVLTVNAYSLSGGVLSCESRRYGPSPSSPSSSSSPFPTYEVVERDASYGTVLRRTTRLTSDGTVVADEQSVYDSQNRLRSTTYLDGTSLTNAYSCCRLLWSRDREGRKTLRSAMTGTDHLYNAMEDVWLGEVENGKCKMENEWADNTNGFKVTQHYFDALGRETNTVVGISYTPSASSSPTSTLHFTLYTLHSSYPYGGSDYAVRTDERGKVTIIRQDILGDCIETGEAVFTNGVEVVKTKSRYYFGGGSSMRREWGGDKWTEERRFTDYAADGKRIEYVVTESYDCGTVTNSVSTYDLLGRLVSSAVPCVATTPSSSSFAITTYSYDDTSSRILLSTYMAGEVVRTTAYLYNNFGEQVGTVLDDITDRTDTEYEQISNEWWKVETTSVIGPHTNSLTITQTQLTGLSAGCRHTVTLVGASVPLARTESLATYDPVTDIETETVTSSIAPSVTRRRMYGVLLSEETGDTTNFSDYDALGRVIATSRQIGRDALVASVQSFNYAPCGDLLAVHTYTNGTDIISETYAYDLLGNRVVTTDALGNTIFKSYDPFGNVVAEYGATYPVRYTYDSQSRRTSLSTTRDGTTWDTTTWTFDPATGFCTLKTYADGSTVAYSYTPDGKPLRTTYAGGRWKEYVYDERRQIVSVEYSDGDIASFDHDAFLNEIEFSNDIAAANLDRDANGNCTNDTTVVGDEVKTTRRTFDPFRRLTGIDGTIYDYTADGLLASISNDIAIVEYAYTPDRLDAGYSLTLSNGVVFARNILRDGYRRSLVTGISSTTNGVGAGNLVYTYDALNRPTARNNDTFGYNARSEVTAATIGGIASAYGYDEIGNSTNWMANCLNQYTEFTHDADGNMMQCGDWTYIYDAANRLKTVSSNGVLLATNYYDAKSRRVKKITPKAATTFFYDGWNLIEERIAYTNGTHSMIRYFWGKDLSGTLQGTGGVGGLLYLTIDGVPYIPCYDSIGNIMRYLDTNGNIVAQYIYDTFGKNIAQSGPLANLFRHRFSTKYLDVETSLYHYIYRFYCPVLMRWLNRDPIEERGGENLYQFTYNNPIVAIDILGWRTYMLGWHGEPKINFDNDFPYDPNAKATLGDYWNWAKWKSKLNGARLIGHLEDGTLMYRHYLEGTGTPMTIDYMKAYREDSGIAASVRNAVKEAQRAAESLAKTGGREFKMSSDAGNADKYPTTENWQKAIGGHSIWGEAQVYNCKDDFSTQITIHALDRYNFNKGAADIATGAPDSENGRFEVLGWAKSFTTRGSIPVTVDWKRGTVGEMEVGSSGRWPIGRSRARGR